MSVDGYNNVIDSSVGYARGSILGAPADEYRRGRHATEVLRLRLRARGTASVYNFTGHQCRFPLQSDDIAEWADETIGPAYYGPRLERLAVAHLAGRPHDRAAIFNRTSAGIIAAVLALARAGDAIVSVVPGAPSHPCVSRAAALARAELLEVSSLDVLADTLSRAKGSLSVITGVTSDLMSMPSTTFAESIRMCHDSGRIVLVDDAYGARVRPVIYDQPPAREVGADLVITSSQKAGLRGPRAGILVGRPDLVNATLARAMELGLEARAPLALGVMRTLESYRPEHLLSDVETGKRLSVALIERVGANRVSATALGPLMTADDLLAAVLERAGIDLRPKVVPAEAAAALGMLLLEHYGILTVNAQGLPGARVSLRLKSTKEDVDRFGGASTVAEAVDNCLGKLAVVISEPAMVRHLILGPDGDIG